MGVLEGIGMMRVFNITSMARGICLSVQAKTCTVAVKEKPILNDACMKEALEAGLDEVATLITTGSDSVGVVESMISDEFKEILLNAPFVISKGMGNFEGLTEMNLEGQDIFVLLCTKCSSISKELGLDEGSHVLTTL